MNLKTFKDQYLFTPSQVIIIDRSFELDGDVLHALALTYKDNTYSLWIMDCLSEEIDEFGQSMNPLELTHRENLRRKVKSEIRHIEKLEVDGKVLYFNGSTTESVSLRGDKSLHRLQYFIEQGIELNYWNGVNLSKLRLTEHRYSEHVPIVDMNLRDNDIKLTFGPYTKEAEVFHKYRLAFNLENAVELKYFNPFEEKEASLYIHKFETYDMEDYLKSLNQNERFNDLQREHFEAMKRRIQPFFDDLKLKDSSMVLMTYEADNSLLFYTTEYLERNVVRSTSRSSMGFIFNPDNKIGKFGKRMSIATFQDVPNNNLDYIEFELHSVFKIYPKVEVVI